MNSFCENIHNQEEAKADVRIAVLFSDVARPKTKYIGWWHGQYYLFLCGVSLSGWTTLSSWSNDLEYFLRAPISTYVSTSFLQFEGLFPHYFISILVRLRGKRKQRRRKGRERKKEKRYSLLAPCTFSLPSRRFLFHFHRFSFIFVRSIVLDHIWSLLEILTFATSEGENVQYAFDERGD